MMTLEQLDHAAKLADRVLALMRDHDTEPNALAMLIVAASIQFSDPRQALSLRDWVNTCGALYETLIDARRAAGAAGKA